MKTLTTMSVFALVLLAGCEKSNIYAEPHSIGVVQVTAVKGWFMEPLKNAELKPYRDQTREMCKDWGFKREYRTNGVTRKNCLNQHCTRWEETFKATCVKE